MNRTLPKIDWTPEEYASFGLTPQVSRQPYDSLSMFNNAGLAVATRRDAMNIKSKRRNA